MSIPDLPTLPEVSGQSAAGTKYHILGTVQQTLVIELQPKQLVYSDAGAMSWMTSTISMNTTTGGGLGGMLKRAVSGGTAFIIDFAANGAAGQFREYETWYLRLIVRLLREGLEGRECSCFFLSLFWYG